MTVLSVLFSVLNHSEVVSLEYTAIMFRLFVGVQFVFICLSFFKIYSDGNSYCLCVPRRVNVHAAKIYPTLCAMSLLIFLFVFSIPDVSCIYFDV